MPRPAAEIKAEKDELDRQRVEVDTRIQADRQILHELNQRVPALEREYQAAVALEQQAAAATNPSA